MKKINKHGFLLGEETVKIIIAVICLVALVYFLASLYLANRNRELELAKASLEKLITDINAKKTETEIYNPDGWGIVSFPSSALGAKIELPLLCSNRNWEKCICICNRYRTHSGFDCYTSNNAVCQESDFTVTGSSLITGPNVIPISSPPVFLSINQNPQEKTITRKT